MDACCGVTWINLDLYLLGLMWASGFFNVEAKMLNDISVGLGMAVFLLLGPVLTHFVVVPKYRGIYPDSSFLRSKIRLSITYVVIQICVFGLAVSLVS